MAGDVTHTVGRTINGAALNAGAYRIVQAEGEISAAAELLGGTIAQGDSDVFARAVVIGHPTARFACRGNIAAQSLAAGTANITVFGYSYVHLTAQVRGAATESECDATALLSGEALRSTPGSALCEAPAVLTGESIRTVYGESNLLIQATAYGEPAVNTLHEGSASTLASATVTGWAFAGLGVPSAAVCAATVTGAPTHVVAGAGAVNIVATVAGLSSRLVDAGSHTVIAAGTVTGVATRRRMGAAALSSSAAVTGAGLRTAIAAAAASGTATVRAYLRVPATGAVTVVPDLVAAPIVTRYAQALCSAAAVLTGLGITNAETPAPAARTIMVDGAVREIAVKPQPRTIRG